MKTKVRTFLFILLAGVLFLGGCQQAKKPVTPPKTTPSNPSQVTESDKRVMANRFSSIAQGVEGVTQATVVVTTADASLGKTSGATTNPAGSTNIQGGKMVVMVGLTLNSKTMANTDSQQNIKNTVKTSILNSDKRISDVLVTTDANMVKKINDVAAGLIEGKPVLSYAKSAAELGKMMKTQVK